MTTTNHRTIRIGGGSGYWGDSPQAARQLVEKGRLDYLVFDYLAEVTMSILVRARDKSADAGYARDFVDLVMKPLLPEIKRQGIRVVANAGGVNTAACAAALAAVAREAGITLRIATVAGDDLSDRTEAFRAQGVTEMFSGAPLPENLVSANAYLGAFPIAAALDAGADVVITGRCVDSAATLGPLIHEFGWTPKDYDRLATGTLAGHILECGAQATGGNFTDWRDVADGWSDMGYPIAECQADGGFVITKPEGTGGLVSRLSVSEQIVYEIGDPAAYLMPDASCDFSQATVTEEGRNRVRVAGAKGRPPPCQLKVSATWRDGYRATASTVVTGFDAVAKAETFAEALLSRVRGLLLARDLGDWRGTAVHLIGAETLHGANARPEARRSREVMVRIDVRHDQRAALELFSKEVTGAALAMTTGRCSGGGGRPKVTPVVAQFAFLVDRDAVTPTLTLDGEPLPWTPAPIDKQERGRTKPGPTPSGPTPPQPEADMIEVPLIALAVARSGDKGDSANIGVVARAPELLPWIRQALTAERVGQWFAHVMKGSASRYDAPGLLALNFLLTRTLDGGGTSSLHLDAQGKSYAQQLLAMPVAVPAALAARHARAVHSAGEEVS